MNHLARNFGRALAFKRHVDAVLARLSTHGFGLKHDVVKALLVAFLPDFDQVPVGTGTWDSKGRPSYAKVDRLLRIDPDDVRREGAILDKARFDDVVGNLAKYHDIVRR